MPILPVTASPKSASEKGRKRGIGQLPSASGVPGAPIARDPGVRVPEGAFDSTIGAVADAALPVLDTFRKIEVEQNNRRDTIDSASKINEYNLFSDTLLRKYNAEKNMADGAVLQEFGAELEGKRQELLGG